LSTNLTGYRLSKQIGSIGAPAISLRQRLLSFSAQQKTPSSFPLRPLAVRVPLGNASLARPGPVIIRKAQGSIF